MSRIRVRVLRVLLAAPFLTLLFSATAQAQSPVPAWDYAMPSRFVDRDPTLPDPTPLNEGFDAYLSGSLHPASWPVDFDACATAGPVAAFEWYVDDVLIESRSVCSGFRYEFPSEGTYMIRLVAVGALGERIAEERAIAVEDLLIFGIGDSYGSGEGNPDVPIDAALLDQYSDSLDALAEAQADADAAYASWQTALAVFNPIVARVNTAKSRLNTWRDAVDHRNDVCSTFPFTGCGAAQVAASTALANLILALANIGIPDPGTYSYSAILNSINNVYNAALATYTAAESAWLAASAVVNDTQALVDQLKDGLVVDWQNEFCHRSAFSGQVRAARRIELADPHTSVTFVHLACSGSRIIGGSSQDLIGPDQVSAGMLAVEAVNPAYQVGLMRSLALGRVVDGVFLSIGGNDAEFAKIIEACIATEPCHLLNFAADAAATAALDATCLTAGFHIDDCAFDFDPVVDDAATIFANARANLPQRYASLAGWMDGWKPSLHQYARRRGIRAGRGTRPCIHHRVSGLEPQRRPGRL